LGVGVAREELEAKARLVAAPQHATAINAANADL
jgi:hypothetical protein